MILCPPALLIQTRLVFIVTFLFVAGCGPQQAVKTAPVAPPPTANAETKIRTGDFLGAALEYTRLAEGTVGEKGDEYRMIATLAFLDTGDTDSADSLLAVPAPNSGVAIELHKLALATRHLATSQTSGSANLEGIDPSRFSAYARNVYQRTQAALARRSGDFASAAKLLIAAERYQLPPEKRAALHNDIWLSLSRMNIAELQSLADTGTSRTASWYRLAAVAQPNLHNSAALATALAAWQVENPQHPANESLIEHLYEISESLSAQARHIALILPFNGKYAAAARAIRDGFLSAWFAEPESANRPTVSMYAINDSAIKEVYELAVVNGADLIVGPLDKRNVKALRAMPELFVRTLALNVADDDIGGDTVNGDSRFFQFALTPEDEAAEAAEKIWSDGHLRAVSMIPQSDWGKRVNDAFVNRWEKLGGVMLTTAEYSGEESSYSKTVKQALNVDLSEARAEALRQALNRSVQFEPRRRQDVDAIFVAGQPLNSRQLMPQLRYFRAESVPVYATSHSYAGRENAAVDQDLDGLRFGDMPWLFGAADEESFSSYARHWPNSAPGSGRLFAFGIDAYRLLPYLARMRHQPNLRIPGTTGLLRMTENGRVIRNLTWARFESGIPVLIHR